MDTMDVEEELLQEVAIIENYAATRFWPRNVFVLKDVPVRLYLTRLHREHVNRFSVSPFFAPSDRILPGEIGIIEFMPDQVGEVKIRNEGHNFDADLIVVETIEEKKQALSGEGHTDVCPHPQRGRISDLSRHTGCRCPAIMSA